MKVPTGHLLTKLRSLFKNCLDPGSIDIYLVLSNDRHMSEYCSEADQRRKFITGFSGSAGTAIVTQTEALLWTDSRYHIDATSCLDENWTLMKDGNEGVPKIDEWFKNLPENLIVGTDPNLISCGEWDRFNDAITSTGKQFVPVHKNLIDIIWAEHNKPVENLSKPYVHDLKFCGISWQNKISKIREEMKKRKSECLVLSSLDEIAWLLNLRGSDIHCCPVFKAYCIITPDHIHLFIDENRLDESVKNHLKNTDSNAGTVIIHSYDSVENFLKNMSEKAKNIWINRSTPQSLAYFLPKNKIVETNPVNIEKAKKNETELENIKKACIREAALLCEFFGYIEKNINSTSMTEYEASELLTNMRSKMENIVMNSFDSIISVGSNAAIIHYKPKPKSSKKLNVDEIFLCDTGGNYLDGTTDITRTMHFGKPSDFEKEAYTLVLKSHIALALAKFPEGTTGHQIDCLARNQMWELGLNFHHGTGHGIGMFLNVHEGPQNISPRPGGYKLELNNLLSNEPGYYEEDKFGIRIESMIVVKPYKTKYQKSDPSSYQFETISYVPMHRNLIDTTLLTPTEISWLNDFNEKCLKYIKPMLEKLYFSNGLDYLMKNTQMF